MLEDPVVGKETKDQISGDEENDYYVSCEYLIKIGGKEYVRESKKDNAVSTAFILGSGTIFELMVLIRLGEYIIDDIKEAATYGYLEDTKSKKAKIKHLKKSLKK